ncbi:hypothetical protein HDU98_001632 [Podochytrium sp. JEL0797]|nr:hypothetical protein HDU98_001632 [Podochytrium sp. JEL0797]
MMWHPLATAVALLLAASSLNALSLSHHQSPLNSASSHSIGPYAGHRIIRLPVSPGERKTLNERLINTMGVVSVLSWGTKHVDIQVDALFGSLLSLGTNDAFDSRVVVENVQSLVDSEMNRLAVSRISMREMSTEELYAPENWFSEYHTYPEITAWFKSLAAQHPDLITFIPSIGKTYLKKDIMAIKLTSPVNKETKPQFWYHSGDHAREWIGPATLQYVVHSLVTNHVANPSLLDSAELIIVPLMNIDGYEHTWSGSRLWRKNRRPIKQDFFGSIGVDLNRNWPAHWGEGGSSSYPFSDTYMGPSAGSEPETQALMDFFMNDNHTRLIGAIDLHSFSQLVLRPYGWTDEPAPDEKLLKQAGDGIRDAIKTTSGKKYVSEREIDLYMASGTASDWFYDKQVQEWLPDRRLYAYTIELRPSADEANGGEGFILPPSQIVATGQEIYNALVGYMQFAVKNPLMTTLSSLPYHIVELILSWIPPKKDWNLRTLSKTFATCLSSSSFAHLNLAHFVPFTDTTVTESDAPTEYDTVYLNAPSIYQTSYLNKWCKNLKVISWFASNPPIFSTNKIPDTLTTLQHLVILELQLCCLTGEIPFQIGSLASLEKLLLGGNALTGTIPASIGDLKKLKLLYLDSNHLIGPIPANLGNCCGLTILSLGRNASLDGPIPHELGNLLLLQIMDLSWCALTGSIPVKLGQLGKLEELLLGSNRLSEVVPVELAGLQMLREVDLQMNIGLDCLFEFGEGVEFSL